jgi:hypothetical protein
MLPIQFLKRFFPNAPDWLMGGLLLVCLLWLVVLPIEIFNIVVRQEFWGPLNWIPRLLYMWGFAASFFWIAPFASAYAVSDQLGELVIVYLGLIIASPAYFVMGALFATRRTVTITLGILLTIINIIFSCVASLKLLSFYLRD